MICKFFKIFIPIIGVFFLSKNNNSLVIERTNNSSDKILYQACLLYESKKYEKSLKLFNRLVSINQEKLKKALLYKTARSNFKVKNYFLAGVQFSNFYHLYPNDKFSEEALFKSAYCSYLSSKDFELDQKNTYLVIERLRFFLKKYPYKKNSSKAKELLEKLLKITEKKSFERSKTYYNMMQYKAAYVSFKNFLNDFRDFRNSSFREEAIFYMFLSKKKL
ncbi:MAG TPA: outer membrane protein assembly factor BamD [Blattabacteriaceae bacterium]